MKFWNWLFPAPKLSNEFMQAYNDIQKRVASMENDKLFERFKYDTIQHLQEIIMNIEDGKIIPLNNNFQFHDNNQSVFSIGYVTVRK